MNCTGAVPVLNMAAFINSLQSEVRQPGVHPTWFICNEDFIVSVFIKSNWICFIPVHMCCSDVRLNYWHDWCFSYIAHRLFQLLTVGKATQSSDPKSQLFQIKACGDFEQWAASCRLQQKFIRGRRRWHVHRLTHGPAPTFWILSVKLTRWTFR